MAPPVRFDSLGDLALWMRRARDQGLTFEEAWAAGWPRNDGGAEDRVRWPRDREAIRAYKAVLKATEHEWRAAWAGEATSAARSVGELAAAGVLPTGSGEVLVAA